MARTPIAGNPLNSDDVEMIISAIETRKVKFPDETAILTITLILLNIGERFRTIECQEGEYVILQKDLGPNIIMKCPNGHDLFKGKGIKLGWIEDE